MRKVLKPNGRAIIEFYPKEDLFHVDLVHESLGHVFSVKIDLHFPGGRPGCFANATFYPGKDIVIHPHIETAARRMLIAILVPVARGVTLGETWTL